MTVFGVSIRNVDSLCPEYTSICNEVILIQMTVQNEKQMTCKICSVHMEYNFSLLLRSCESN
jgi:hypothetical protein